MLHLLRVAADPDGFVPFDRFMEVALYADGVGYYHGSSSPLGTAGDFYTAAHVDPLFSESLAHRILEVRAAVEKPHGFVVVELGPGDGTLATGLLRALAPSGTIAEYVLVDRSPARARESASRVEAGGSAVPVRTAPSLAALGPVTAAVVANELLDAQPVRRLQWEGSAWRELGIRVVGDRVQAAVGGEARSVPGPPLPSDPIDGLIVEVSPMAEGIVRETADHLEDGTAILLDFGEEESELVHAHPGGTLAAVRAHRSVADPLAHPGAADLSTFVNFSRIRSVARTSGMVELAYRSQAESLGAWGFESLRSRALAATPDAETRVRRQLAAKNLLFGFERFRVLELAPSGTAGRLGPAR